jgi:hypothetical protein
MLYQTLINAPAHARTPPHTNTRYRTGWSMVEDSVRLVRFILQVSTRRGDARSAFAGKITHPSNRAGYTGELSLEHRISIVRGCQLQSHCHSLCVSTRVRAKARARKRERRLRERTHVCVLARTCKVRECASFIRATGVRSNGRMHTCNVCTCMDACMYAQALQAC